MKQFILALILVAVAVLAYLGTTIQATRNSDRDESINNPTSPSHTP